MARYIGPVCRLCRREGAKLFLKGDRCYTEKCAVERRAYPPGQHGQARRAVSTTACSSREAEGEAHVRPAGAAVRGTWTRPRA